MSENKSNNFWVGFFLGGLFGAILIFLWGTKEGKKVAKRILEKGELFEEEIEDKVKNLEEQGEKLLSETREVKEQITEKIEEKKADVSEGLVTKMDTALSKLEEIQKKGIEATQNAHRFFKKDGKSLTS